MNVEKTKNFSLATFSVALVTGGSSGIGESFIETLYKINPRIKICNLSRSKIAKKLQISEVSHYSCDLQDFQQTHAVLQTLAADLASFPEGKLLLINNSGFGSYGEFSQLETQKELNMLSVNVRGPLVVTQALLPELEKRGGAIINVASTASFQPTPYFATYGATKSFLRHWSLSLAYELRKKGILVQCLCPGPTKSNFFKEAGFSKAPMSDSFGETAPQVVEKSLRALEKGKWLVVSGWQNKLLTAFTGKLPLLWATHISGALMRKLRLEKKM